MLGPPNQGIARSIRKPKPLRRGQNSCGKVGICRGQRKAGVQASMRFEFRAPCQGTVEVHELSQSGGHVTTGERDLPPEVILKKIAGDRILSVEELLLESRFERSIFFGLQIRVAVCKRSGKGLV